MLVIPGLRVIKPCAVLSAGSKIQLLKMSIFPHLATATLFLSLRGAVMAYLHIKEWSISWLEVLDHNK
jgi:hypothetical protein